MITQKFAEPEIQLDFKDVLIKPKQSPLSSRSQVHLAQTYKFKHSPHTYHGIPVIAANMDTVGTMTAAKVMASHQCMVALHKHYSVAALAEFFGKDTTEEGKELLKHNKHHQQHTFYSMGMVTRDLEKFREVVAHVGLWKHSVKDEDNSGIKMVCIDVANGYMDAFVAFCKQIRKEFPELIIMAGNVVTYEMTKELLENGVDVAKIGIGSGCVPGNTLVKTQDGLKEITDIKIGEMVLTGHNRYKEVTKLFKFNHHVGLRKINDLFVTSEHNIYLKEGKYRAGDIKIGMHFQKSDGSYEEITSIETLAFQGLTYDIEVKDDHSYFANNYLVSNSVCTTRVTAGVGRPQLSAILDCQRAAEECGGYIVSDGGITCIGDFPRAFGSGSWGVMAGGMFAGHEESEMEIIEKDGKKFMQFYGMSSAEAMFKYAGGVAEYRASEGKKVEVPFKGSLDKTTQEILGGIRSAHTYVGASHLKEFASHVQYFIVKQEVNEYWGRSK